MSIITNPLNPLKVRRLDIVSSRNVPVMALMDVGADLVEFWDLRYPMPHFNSEVRTAMNGTDMPGQFVSRYSIGEISRPDGGNLWSPLILDGDMHDWRIDGPAMSIVRRWMHFTVNRTATGS